MVELSSTHSTRVSLEAVRSGEAGLNERRANMLRRVPEIGDWAKFPYEHLEMKDLAFLTAKTGHEFAILRGKDEDILVHGTARNCLFDAFLSDLLMLKKLIIIGHSHPGEDVPVESPEDIAALQLIGQKKSRIISARTGIEKVFTSNPFEVEV